MNSNRFSHKNRASAASEPSMRPIDTAVTPTIRSIWLFLHYLCDILDVSAAQPHVRPIEAASDMTPERPIDASAAALEK